MFKKIISLFLSLSLIITQPIFAQGVAQLNLAQYLGQTHPAAIDSFRPAQLRYFSYDEIKNSFQILLDKGDAKDIKDNQLKQEAKELMDYFLIGLTLPNDAFWVNLRPDSQDNIIDPELEKTDLGRILLEADLQLKKDTAGLTSPQTTEGQAYWDKLYKKAGELFGTENITIPTITRPWIVPGEIIVRESGASAYIYKAALKVMLEEDYLVSRGEQSFAPTYQQYAFSDSRMKELNKYSTQLIRELIIPKLIQEVNSSKRYAQLRQVYYSLVLSRWFKMRFAGKSGQYADLIDRHNLTNLIAKEPYDKLTYFKQYQESFAKGEYNLKEPVYTPYGQSIRAYMSGGLGLGNEITKAISGVNAPETAESSILGESLENRPDLLPLEISGNSLQIKFTNQEQRLAIAASPLTVKEFKIELETFLKGIEENNNYPDRVKACKNLIMMFSGVDKDAKLSNVETNLIHRIILKVIGYNPALKIILRYVVESFYSNICVKTEAHTESNTVTAGEILKVIEYALAKPIPESDSIGYSIDALNGQRREFLSAVKNALEVIANQGQPFNASPVKLDVAFLDGFYEIISPIYLKYNKDEKIHEVWEKIDKEFSKMMREANGESFKSLLSDTKGLLKPLAANYPIVQEAIAGLEKLSKDLETEYKLDENSRARIQKPNDSVASPLVLESDLEVILEARKKLNEYHNDIKNFSKVSLSDLIASLNGTAEKIEEVKGSDSYEEQKEWLNIATELLLIRSKVVKNIEMYREQLSSFYAGIKQNPDIKFGEGQKLDYNEYSQTIKETNDPDEIIAAAEYAYRLVHGAASPVTMDKIILNMRKLIKNIQNNFDQYTAKGIFLPDNYNEYRKYIRSLSRELDELKSPRIIKMLTDEMNAEIAKDKEEAENAFKASYRDSDEDEYNKKEIYYACINILNQLKKIDEYADEYEESFEMLLFINMSVLFNGILEIGQSERTIFNDELDGIFKKEFERLRDGKKFIKDNFYDSYMSKTPLTKYLELDATHFMIMQEHMHTEGKGLNKDWAKLEGFIFRVLRQYYLGIVNEINNKNAQEVKTAARKLKEILKFKTYTNLARINMGEYQNYVVLVSMAKLENDRMKRIPPNLPIVSLAQPPETVASPVGLDEKFIDEFTEIVHPIYVSDDTDTKEIYEAMKKINNEYLEMLRKRDVESFRSLLSYAQERLKPFLNHPFVEGGMYAASPLTGAKLKDAGPADFVKGGIDFTSRAMKIGIERMGSFADLQLVLPEVSNAAGIDLDAEFKQIQLMASSGIRPSDIRILEFEAACYYRGEFGPRLGEITSCLQQAHFLDERLGRESSPALRLATLLPEVM